MTLSLQATEPPVARQVDTEACDRLATIKRQIESLQAESASIKSQLVDQCTFTAGPSERFATSDPSLVVRVTRALKYAAIPGSEARKLRASIGRDLTSALFTSRTVLTAKKGANIGRLLGLMAAKGLDPQDWFDVKHELVPCSDLEARVESFVGSASVVGALRAIVEVVRKVETRVYCEPPAKPKKGRRR